MASRAGPNGLDIDGRHQFTDYSLGCRSLRLIVRRLIAGLLSLAVAGCDLFTPPEQPGGVIYDASVVEQLDSRTLRVDLGPAKGSEQRGLVIVHAIPATRFNLGGGGRSVRQIGSLNDSQLGGGTRVTVRIVNSPRADGSYTLLELTTNTR